MAAPDPCDSLHEGCFTKIAWREAYRNWRANLGQGKIQPYLEQWMVLDLVHDRCVREHLEKLEAGEDVAEEILQDLPQLQIPEQTDVVMKFVHGLPGSGKTQLLKWIRSYFEEVWRWVQGNQFIFLAPLNSMAANIDGATIHSWGEIGFIDRQGRYIASKSKKEDDVSTLAGLLDFPRWILIDEIEASGTELLSLLNEEICRKAPYHSPYRLSQNVGTAVAGECS